MTDEEVFSLYEDQLGGHVKPGESRAMIEGRIAQLVCYVKE